jgi:hypothetical protein
MGNGFETAQSPHARLVAGAKCAQAAVLGGESGPEDGAWSNFAPRTRLAAEVQIDGIKADDKLIIGTHRDG